MGGIPSAELWKSRLTDLQSDDVIRQSAAFAHLRNLVLRCLGRRRLASLGDDAEDFIQERIADLATGRVEVRSFDTFEAFVGRIARTRFIDRMRQSGRRRAWLRELLDIDRLFDRSHVSPLDADPVRVRHMLAALESLDTEATTIVEMRQIKGWTLKQTADHLGVSITRIHQREKRILQQLRAALAGNEK